MNETKIKVEDLTLIFGNDKKRALRLAKEEKSKDEILAETKCTLAVNSASFEVKKGEVFVIMGLSGSGKSTLLRCINRLINPTTGSITINDINITALDEKALLETRRKQLRMVFQNFGLLPHRTVAENVAFGLEIQKMDKVVRLEKAMKSLEVVGLKGYEDMYPAELSGGMQQRVGLARALANDSEVLLMDEAFSALDPLIRNQMQDELLELQGKMHKTIVFITHDLDEAIKLGDRIAIMKDGKIVQIGTSEEILTNPADDYVKSFVEKVDRKSIITAESLMFDKPTIVRYGKDGPEVIIRRMRETGLTVLPVVENGKYFKGMIELGALVQSIRNGDKDIEKSILYSEVVPSVYKDYTVEQMLPLITNSNLPLPVVDEENKLLGIVLQASIIIESTGIKQKEIHEQITKAKTL